MAEKPKFIPAKTEYGFDPTKRLPLGAENTELLRRMAELKPTVRTGEQLTQSDKDELAILRQQIQNAEDEKQAKIGKAYGQTLASSADSRTSMTYEESRRLQEEFSKKMAEKQAEKTMIVEPLPAPGSEKKGFWKKIFGK